MKKKPAVIDVLIEIRDLLKEQTGKINNLAEDYPIAYTSQSTEYLTLKIPKGLTIEAALAECKKLFPVWRYTDKNFDELVTSDRTTKKAYTIAFKNMQEADEEMKNLSADDIKEKGIKTITLLERIVMELEYFKATGKHLDIDNWTLCAGSRYSDGRVPCARWGDDKFDVSWTRVGYRYPDMRARVAVS